MLIGGVCYYMKLQNSFKSEFRNKKILITGGTGSIGIGLIKQLLPYKPKIIKVFTNDENSIFETTRKFWKNPIISFEMGDIRDKDRLDFVKFVNSKTKEIDENIFFCNSQSKNFKEMGMT